MHVPAFCPRVSSTQALSAMVKLELPHINLLTKMDLAEDKAAVEEYRIPDKQLLLDRCVSKHAPRACKTMQ